MFPEDTINNTNYGVCIRCLYTFHWIKMMKAIIPHKMIKSVVREHEGDLVFSSADMIQEGEIVVLVQNLSQHK